MEVDQRIQILIRPQGINKHVGIEIETEDYRTREEIIQEAVNFINETMDFMEERYSDDDENADN